MGTNTIPPTLAGLPLELKNIIYHYVLEKECRNRICLPWNSTLTIHKCHNYCPSLLLVNKQIGWEFATVFRRETIFVTYFPDHSSSEVVRQSYARGMRIFVHLEVKVAYPFSNKPRRGPQITDFQLHVKNMTTIVLNCRLLWDGISPLFKNDNHDQTIALLQNWRSTWQNSVITMRPLDILTKYKAKRAVTDEWECLMNSRRLQRAWGQAFGAEMIVNKIVEECSPRDLKGLRW